MIDVIVQSEVTDGSVATFSKGDIVIYVHDTEFITPGVVTGLGAGGIYVNWYQWWTKALSSTAYWAPFDHVVRIGWVQT